MDPKKKEERLRKKAAEELKKKYNNFKQGIIDLGYPIDEEYDIDFENNEFTLWSTVKSKNNDYDIHFEFKPGFEEVLTFRLELSYWISEDDISEKKRTLQFLEFHKALGERTDEYTKAHEFSLLYIRHERELYFIQEIKAWNWKPVSIGYILKGFIHEGQNAIDDIRTFVKNF